MERFRRLIQPGEYDLANISLIGYDPRTGLSYEACQDAWDAEYRALRNDFRSVRWWQFLRRIKITKRFNALISHLGL